MIKYQQQVCQEDRQVLAAEHCHEQQRLQPINVTHTRFKQT